MIKKTFTALTLALALLLGVSSAQAQHPSFGFDKISPESLKELEKEPPLTQADIDSYIKIIPELGKTMGDQTALAKLQKESGLSEARLGMILTKISLAQTLSMGISQEQLNAQLGTSVPDVMKPSDAEIELVKKNSEKINAGMMKMVEGMSK